MSGIIESPAIATAESVIAETRRRTGLTDYGDQAIIDGLARLLKAYTEEASFTPRGYQAAARP